MSQKAAAVIGKLLRKAETTHSREEADALVTKAQELATRYSIDLALARRADELSQSREVVEERTVVIGRPRQRHVTALRRLFTVIAQVNDVEVLMRGGESEVYPIGMPSDLNTVEALYRSLVVQLVAAADRWLASGAHRELSGSVHTSTARGVFYDGFIQRIASRLSAAQARAVEEAVARERPATGKELSSVALAMRAKSAEVGEFISAKYPRVGVRRTRVSHAGQQTESIRAAGRRAADQASLAQADGRLALSSGNNSSGA
ncbi:DUF2786 domain-containing protein [Propionibacteriaceae bacterium Y1923]|uniref:DUF2786 domain-containing protein n=1 Tax=Aestuariimicrobium sp. Y1814 TaxID=3418742 RepID=UPI003C1DC7F9